MNPIGISLEIGKDKRGWFLYIGRQKLLHVRPTRHKNDTGKNFIFDYFKRGKYNSRDWHVAKYGGVKFDLGIGKLRRPFPKFWTKKYFDKRYMIREPATNPWNSGKPGFVILPRLFLPLPYFFLSVCYGKEKQPGFQAGFRTYLVNKISQGVGEYYRGDPWSRLYKKEYPKFVSWGSPKEAGNIYCGLSFRVRNNLVA